MLGLRSYDYIYFMGIFCHGRVEDGQVLSDGLLLANLTTFLVSILSILRQPMILLGLVSMGIFIGMPYLVDNSKSPTRNRLSGCRLSPPLSTS